MDKISKTWFFKGPFILGSIATCVLVPFFLAIFADSGIEGLQAFLKYKIIITGVSLSLSAFIFGTMGCGLYFLDRLPKNESFWSKMEFLFDNQKVNDSSIEGLITFASSVVLQMEVLEKTILHLKGAQREKAVLEVVKKIAKHDYIQNDLRKSPRIAFVINSFVSAMTRLAESHPDKTEILELLEKFKRQEEAGDYHLREAA